VQSANVAGPRRKQLKYQEIPKAHLSREKLKKETLKQDTKFKKVEKAPISRENRKAQ